ncbi:MAG: TAXI family TRAP transporter solute-binding subunit [Selenomonadaceae bacterium]|nr:TAXI family TRAP transporter solute-binding subunit [Selenomonadaceae bacterium]
MKFLKFLLLLPILALCFGCGSENAPNNNSLRLGTGGEGGMYYTYGTKLAQLTADDKKIRPLDVKTTAGSASNLRLFQKNGLDLAIVQSDTLSDAINGRGKFADDDKGVNYAAVAAIYPEVCQIVVLKDSGIQTINDLVGKRVSISDLESGSMKNALQILEAHGITKEMFSPLYMSFAEAAAALQDDIIDAFFVTACVPSLPITNLAGNKEIRLLSISEEAQKNLMNLDGGYTQYKISANSYKGQTEEVSTIAVKAVLVASTEIPDKEISYLTEFVLKNYEKLPHDENIKLDVNFATEDVPAGFHAGAAKFYESQGVTVEVFNGKN